MNYYRKPIDEVANDVKLKMQLGALTLKISENNKKIDDLIGVDKDIKNDVSTNSGQISTNKNNISTNLAKIENNKSSISTNLEKIDNFTQYVLEKSSKVFKQKQIIKNQIFRFNKNKHFYTLFEKEIEYYFLKNSLLFVKNNMYYKYENLSNDYYRLQHEYNIYDSENNLIHKYLSNKDTYYYESLDPILHTGEDFCIYFKKNYKKIKLNLQLHRHNRHGVGDVNLEIDDDNKNYINIDYLEKNNENNKKIESNLEIMNTNKRNIASNLGKINTNIADISSNLGKINTNKNDISTNLIKINSNEDDINYIKNNNSKSYLKNVYNILLYDKKTQIDFRKDIFYEKIFELNANKNDFIEMNFRIELEYRDTNDRHYVKSIYEIFDENNNRLYIKSITNNNYLYFSNKLIIDENIFYNFNNNVKKIKFVMKFQKLSSSRVIYVYYIKNENNRFILKHYSI